MGMPMPSWYDITSLDDRTRQPHPHSHPHPHPHPKPHPNPNLRPNPNHNTHRWRTSTSRPSRSLAWPRMASRARNGRSRCGSSPCPLWTPHHGLCLPRRTATSRWPPACPTSTIPRRRHSGLRRRQVAMRRTPNPNPNPDPDPDPDLDPNPSPNPNPNPAQVAMRRIGGMRLPCTSSDWRDRHQT